jgi:hypothetical protein
VRKLRCVELDQLLCRSSVEVLSVIEEEEDGIILHLFLCVHGLIQALHESADSLVRPLYRSDSVGLEKIMDVLHTRRLLPSFSVEGDGPVEGKER